MPRRKAATVAEVLAEDPLEGLEPPLMVEGDVPPDPSSGSDDSDSEAVGPLEGEVEPPKRRGRPKGSRSRRSVAATSDAPRLRASPAAVKGAAALYGYGGVGATLVGSYAGVPGLAAAGFVMQAQSDRAGKIIAKKALGTRWYPYLERAAQGGEMAPIIAGPLAAALFMQFPAFRPAIAPVLDVMIGDLTMADPETGKDRRLVELLYEAANLQEAEAQGIPPMAEPVYGPGPEAERNGDGSPDVPPPFDGPIAEAPHFPREDVPPIQQVWPEPPTRRPE